MQTIKKEEGTTLIREVISRDLLGHHRWVKRRRITIDCCNSPALVVRSNRGRGGEGRKGRGGGDSGELTLRDVCK